MMQAKSYLIMLLIHLSPIVMCSRFIEVWNSNGQRLIALSSCFTEMLESRPEEDGQFFR